MAAASRRALSWFEKIDFFLNLRFFCFVKSSIREPIIALSGTTFAEQNYGSTDNVLFFRLICKKVKIFLFCKKVDSRATDGALRDASFSHFERAWRAHFGQERRR